MTEPTTPEVEPNEAAPVEAKTPVKAPNKSKSAQKQRPTKAKSIGPVLLSHSKASAEALKSGNSVDTKMIFTLPIANIKSYSNPRHEPANLFELGYTLIGDPAVEAPDTANGKSVSLLHMALSDDIAKVQQFVDLMRTHEIVDRNASPNAPQSICELAQDIQDFGQLVPIHVKGTDVGDGGRRLSAILLLHAESRVKIAQKADDAPKQVYPATVEAMELDCTKDELFVLSCKINLSRKGFTELQEGRLYHEMLNRINPFTKKKYTKKEAATELHVHYSTFRNREALWHERDEKTGKGLSDTDRQKVARGEMLPTFASRKSLGERHYSKTGQPQTSRSRALPLSEMQKLFDNTAENRTERRQAIAECMGLSLREATRESDNRVANTERVETGRRNRNSRKGKAA